MFCFHQTSAKRGQRGWQRETRLLIRCSFLVALGWVLPSVFFLEAGGTRPEPQRKARGISYSRDAVADVPWSIHVLKIDRSRADLAFHTTLAKGSRVGLGTMTEQIKTLPPVVGKPIAAINGDFWREGRQPEGDPMGLQIMRGELVSAPGDRACFWIDTNGQPHATNTLPRFTVLWPNGATNLIGLNEERTNGGAVLYTPALGQSARTKKGRELILEHDGHGEWLPLRAGQSLSARVREVREAGDSPLSPHTMVLSLSPQLADLMPKVAAGSILKISTDSTPSLRGVQTAIGGGPTLVRQGKAVQLNSSQARHPRTAIGWNDTFFFFVVVDGRQANLSVGMSLRELASYMMKLGCEEAMNLDGGGSSTFWIYGQVMNSPCYGHERPMANALVLAQKEKAELRTIEAVAAPEAPPDPNLPSPP